MNWEVISQYLPLYQKAMWLTLRIGWMGIAFSIIIGLICALIVHYKIPVARQIVKIYIELFRNTPLLVQLFFIYFGLPKVGLSISADVCGVAGLALLGGSYMAEAFRSGLEAIEPIQMESALSLGMTEKAGSALCHPATGGIHQRTGICGECDLPVKRDECVFSNQSDGSDVYSKRPDRALL